MKVERTIELGDGHKIEFGKATWNENAVSLKNSYPTSNGGFSPSSSSEIPIEDIKVIVKESVKNGYIPNPELIEIAELCIAALKQNQKNEKHLTKAEKIKLMQQAASDPLYLNDVKEISDDFEAVDFEI